MTEEILRFYRVSSLRNKENPKTKGWIISEKNLKSLKNKKYEQKVLTVKVDDLSNQQMLFSNYREETKRKLLKVTSQIVFSLNTRLYENTPVIYYKKEKDKLKCLPEIQNETQNENEPIFINKKGLLLRGKVYVAFFHDTRIINIDEKNLFTILD